MLLMMNIHPYSLTPYLYATNIIFMVAQYKHNLTTYTKTRCNCGNSKKIHITFFGI